MDKLYEDSETGCCQRFDPAPWNEKEIELTNRIFIKDRVFGIFHIPLNFGQVIVRNMEKIKKADALTKTAFMLSDENSLFGSDIYIEVSKNVPETNIVHVPGKFLTKVFEGHYSKMGEWIKEMEKYVQAKGKKMKKMYFFYTTCPKCAKYYGKNYVVILAGI